MTRAFRRILTILLLASLFLMAGGTVLVRSQLTTSSSTVAVGTQLGPVLLQWMASLTVAPESDPNETPQVAQSPYEDWETWAEDPVKPACKLDDDCAPDRTGRETYCKKWKGAPEDAEGFCRPRWLNRKRQAIQRRNLERIVEHVCKPPSWWTPETRCWKFKWRTARQCNQKRWCNPVKLTKFLSIPARRESTWDHQTDHHLDQDLIANRKSYRRAWKKGRYEGNPHFYEGLTLGKNGNPLFRAKDLKYRCDPDNEHDRNCDGVPDRWQVGYGWYGQNAALFTYLWDRQAPPEVLARRVPATMALLRRLRASWRKLEGGVDCRDANGDLYTVKRMLAGEQERDFKKDTWPEQTWWTLHRAAFGGDICPIKIEGHGFYRKRFVARAKSKKVGLDPDESVTLAMLGKPVPFEEQWEAVAIIEASFEPVWEPEEPEEKEPLKLSMGGSENVVVAQAAAP